MAKWATLALLISFSSLLLGCPYEPGHPLLKVRNNADFDIKAYLNVTYPDSSLKNSRPDRHIDSDYELHVGSFYELDEYDGITLFIFRHDYYLAHWHEGVGAPDTYLAEDQVLAKYYLSQRQLDSLGWKLTYP
jgi:hypothetical protein